MFGNGDLHFAFISCYQRVSIFILLYAENWQELVQRIKSKGMKPGVALKPGTPIEDVYPLVLLLSPSFLLCLVFCKFSVLFRGVCVCVCVY